MKSTISVDLGRSEVRDIKRLLSLASGTSIDGRVPVETTKAFALVALRRGISVMTEIYKRAELQTSAEARDTVIQSELGGGIQSHGDRLPQFDKGTQ